MRIGIFGTGGMAEALGGQWARAGHELRVGGRSQQAASRLAERLGGHSGTWREVAAASDVVLLAVPADAVFDIVAAGGGLAGKVLIDCTNQSGPTGTEPPPGTPVAARIAAMAPNAHLVKAFNLAHVGIWRMTPPEFDGRPLMVPVCGDDPTALATVHTLIKDVGCTPVTAGGLDRAALLEATAAFAIGLWFAGADAQAILPPAV